jgi:hypothetical protein
MMEGPGVVGPALWTFAPDVFPQSSQNFATEFSIHRLFCWDKFLLHDALNFYKKININLILLRICAFFGRGEVVVFH